MRRELLLVLLAGAAASPSLPPPLGLLTRRAPPTVTCLSPRRFAGAAFDLLVADTPVRSVSAPPGRHEVQFTLDGAVTSRCYRCRYRHRNGSAWETSAPSAEIAVTDLGDGGCDPPTAPPPTPDALRQDSSWIVPVAVSAAALVLLVLLVAAVAWRGTARRAARNRGSPAPSLAMTAAPAASPC